MFVDYFKSGCAGFFFLLKLDTDRRSWIFLFARMRVSLYTIYEIDSLKTSRRNYPFRCQGYALRSCWKVEWFLEKEIFYIWIIEIVVGKIEVWMYCRSKFDRVLVTNIDFCVSNNYPRFEGELRLDKQEIVSHNCIPWDHNMLLN